MDGPIEAASAVTASDFALSSSVLKMDGPIEAGIGRGWHGGRLVVFRPENGRPH
tara:strand:- start:9625 stop:9786 length:162 start_codon:yes stop_codon:yes gene_type:complete